MQWTTIILLLSSYPAVQSFQMLKASASPRRTGPISSSEFRDTDLAIELLDMVPNIARVDASQEEEVPRMELLLQEDVKDSFPEWLEPVTNIEPTGLTQPEPPKTAVERTVTVCARASQQALMIGKLLGMDSGAFPESSTSGGETKIIPGMRSVPMIKNYQTNKVVQSFRKVGKYYPEIIMPKDLTEPKTYTP